MKVLITPEKLSGNIDAIASKSYAHRIIIAAALADKPTKIYLNTTSEDIETTKRCILSMGAKIEEGKGFIKVYPVWENILKNPILDCSESGSTARFMLPVAAAVCDSFSMIGKGRLPNRPLVELTEEMRKKGVNISSDNIPLTVSGKLMGGEYRIAGNVSSQYITGLLMALPLCNEVSKITLTSELESAAYVDITIAVLENFGIKIKRTDAGYEIENQKYISPGEITVEGDWSNAAFWMVADKIGDKVSVNNLNYNSLQGDMGIIDAMDLSEIDAREIPDLVPVLAVCACSKDGKTVIKNAQRLKLKESDRLEAVYVTLKSLGADVIKTDDGLIINGHKTLLGGVCDGFNDHRIVMSAAIASIICKKSVTITGIEAVNKSYPGFFDDFKKLGGKFITE